jgi:hypothetical protein
MLKAADRFVFAGGVMDVRSSAISRSFWICAAVAVLTSLANSISADSLDTVTVQAQRDRAKLEREVDKFVSSTIVPPNHYDQSLWRWNDKVCPLVAGLNKEQGEFVLARLSEIAKTAGAPLGAETCKPNLYVIVTPDPELLLKRWWRRDVDLFDGESGPTVKRFLETPRPIRVWYSAGTVGVDGQFFVGLLDASSNRAKPSGKAPWVHVPPEAATRLKLTATRNISSVIVVVDSTKIGNINFGQLTDYIGLVGLAQINFEKQPGDVPTILRLFEGSGESRPVEMTVWDRALLHALYSTSQSSTMQISQMQTAALKDIAPKSPN